MLKKLSAKVSLALIAVLAAVMAVFTWYLVRDLTRKTNEVILEKGIASAKTGATIMGGLLDHIVDNGLFTVEEVFDLALTPVRLPKRILDGYRGASRKDLEAVQKYHYASTLDSYLDNQLLNIQDQFLKDPQIVYAVLVDCNGYVPTHNSTYSEALTGDYRHDRDRNRTKRVFQDPVGLAAVHNAERPYLRQVYRRDTGETMWDISAPVFVKGRHWGAFRAGLSIDKTEKAVAALSRKLVALMGLLMLVTALIINRITDLLMRPLDRLHDGVDRVAKGDLSSRQEVVADDEIGDLARAFNKMTADLKEHIRNLQETTASKERIESELKIANEIQASMLPRIFPPFPDKREFDIYAVMEPAKEIAGDFYDFFLIDADRLCFIIGDVSGKGIPAALYMVITKTLLKTQALQGSSPEQVLANVNNILCPDNENCMFATVFCAILDTRTGEMEFSNAGHNPPLILRAGGAFEFMSLDPAQPLAVRENAKFPIGRTRLNPKDAVFLYTDGVTEAVDQDERMFSDGRLREALCRLRDRDMRGLISGVGTALKEFVREVPQFDDITMLAVKFHGPDQDAAPRSS